MANKAAASSKAPAVPARIARLRERMAEHGVAAYLIPSTDPHQSEYVPSCWQRRPWISGFTGSAGDVVISAKDAGLWTDGRYYLQAGAELKGSGVRLFKAADLGTPKPQEWLASTLSKGAKVGYDPRLLSLQQRRDYAQALDERGVELCAIDENLVDAVWDDRPKVPTEQVMALPKKLTGEATASKLRRVRKAMKELGADAHVVTTLDSIAWLFNIRGRDVDFNPVTISYAIVTPDDATLFIDRSKMSDAVIAALGAEVKLRAYEDLGGALAELGAAGRAVLLDPATCNTWVAERCRGAKVIEKASPIPAMKARKNDTEIAGMRAAHVRDGVAVVRFLRWLEEAVPKGSETEISASDKLEALRAEGEHFQGLSFDTISGYAGHGAIIHYRASDASSSRLQARGMYLIDSGGQYLDGTTDITRTVLLGGKATREQRDRFTRVLKGHIALARAVFPKGVSGIRLDTLARLPLWEAGLDYGHGTGHGVGVFLNVHEGPPSISVRGHAALEPGNILSNEPGYYEAGAYGIRIENLVLVTEADVRMNGTPFYRFDTLTLCPIDTRLVEPKLLGIEEKRWLNEYHKTVASTLSPLLAPADKRWLRNATKAIA